MVKAQKWVLAKLFEGPAKVDDFRLEEEELPELQQLEFLCEAVYLTVQPSLRAMSGRGLKVGDTPALAQLAYVTASRNGAYPVGSRLILHTGWRSHTIVRPDMLADEAAPLVRGPPMWAPETDRLPNSLCIGIMGNEGATAFYGVTEVCKAQVGETFFVNAAAGATGSIAGQIAKIKGCTIIGCAGSEEKCRWLREELGFHHVFNYKTQDLDAELQRAAPNGIDCFYDNVGGDMSTRVIIRHMRKNGRVACCGSISTYDKGKSIADQDLSAMPSGPYVFGALIAKTLTVRGFLVADFWSKFYETAHQIRDWIIEGKMKYRESMTIGFENTPSCFVNMMSGSNIGKALVKVSSVLDKYEKN